MKSIEQLQAEARILKEAKQGLNKEKRKERIEKTKKVLSETKQGLKKVFVRKTKKTNLNKLRTPISYKRNLPSNLMKMYGGATGGASQQSQGQRPVGRPRGEFKHRSPFTGKPIPAQVYNKQIRQFRRVQEQQANQIDRQQISQLAKRGIPPEQAMQIVNARQMQSVQQPQLSQEQIRQLMIQKIQEQNQIPQQMREPIQSQAVRPIWRRQGTIRYERDIFGNIKVVEGGNNPKNFWN